MSKNFPEIFIEPSGGSSTLSLRRSDFRNNKAPEKGLCLNMAEREGFEPPVGLTLRLISSQVHSAGLCHLSEEVRRILITYPRLVKH